MNEVKGAGFLPGAPIFPALGLSFRTQVLGAIALRSLPSFFWNGHCNVTGMKMRCEGGRALCWYPPGFPLLLEQREGALREDSLGLCILKGPQVGSGQNPQPRVVSGPAMWWQPRWQNTCFSGSSLQPSQQVLMGCFLWLGPLPSIS